MRISGPEIRSNIILRQSYDEPKSVFTLGDSLTEGLIGDTGCWRARQQTLIDWVGPYTDPVNLKHGGRGGDWLVHASNPDMIDRFAAQFAANPANEVWITGGTNDAVGGTAAATIASNLGLLLDNIIANTPSGTVIRVGTPPPWNPATGATTNIELYWRFHIAQAVATRRAAGNKIFLHHTGGNLLDSDLDMAVSKHPVDGVYGVNGYGKWAAWNDDWINSGGEIDPATLSPEAHYIVSSYNSGTGVWSDISGNARHASPTGSPHPTIVKSQFGTDGLMFANSPLRTGSGWGLSQPNTIICVMSNINNSNSPGIFDGADVSNRNSFQVLVTSGGISLFAGASSSDTNINMSTVGHLIATEFNGTSSKVFLDGCPRSQVASPSTQNLGGLTIGGSAAGTPTNTLTGIITDLVVFNSALTYAQHFGIAKFYRNKHNLWPLFGKTINW